MKDDFSKDKLESAARIRKFRENAGYTQEKFAELMELSLSGYKKIESGENQVSVAFLRKLNHKFHISADYILFGIKEKEDALWERIKKNSEAEKMLLLLKLIFYFSEVKINKFGADEKLAQYDKIMDKILDEMKKCGIE